MYVWVSRLMDLFRLVFFFYLIVCVLPKNVDIMDTYPSNPSGVRLTGCPQKISQVDIVDTTGKKWTFSRSTSWKASSVLFVKRRSRAKTSSAWLRLLKPERGYATPLQPSAWPTLARTVTIATNKLSVRPTRSHRLNFASVWSMKVCTLCWWRSESLSAERWGRRRSQRQPVVWCVNGINKERKGSNHENQTRIAT